MVEKINKLSAFEQLKADAKKSIVEEGKEKWMGELKSKLKQLSQAKQIVRNIEREMEDLEMRIQEEMG